MKPFMSNIEASISGTGRPLLRANICCSHCSLPSLAYPLRLVAEAATRDGKGTMLIWVTGGGGGGVDGGGEGEAEKYDWEGVC